MAAMAEIRDSSATFTETKEIKALTTPLESRGRLIWRAPSHLERHTDTPIQESIVVDGDRLTYAKPAEKVSRTLDLDRVPELRGLVEAIRGTLAGDLGLLRRHYSVGFDGGVDAWKLTLVPLDQRVQRLIRVVEIDGVRAALRHVVTTEADGDTIRMAITPAGSAAG